MKNSYKYFENRGCKYYPCHRDIQNVNCMFCYCPLYNFEEYPGVGGMDGLSSGIVSSPVAASKIINWGYSGVGVFNPYRSFILREL